MRKINRHKNHFGILALLVLAGLSVFPWTALAQQQPAVPAAQVPTPTTQAAAIPAQPPQVGAEAAAQPAEAPQTLHLLVGRSLVITSPNRIKRVALADPAIADAVVVTPNQVVVNGKVPGGVSLIIWDEAGQSQSFEVSVDIDVLGLTQKIHEVFPSEPVQIETSGSVVSFRSVQ